MALKLLMVYLCRGSALDKPHLMTTVHDLYITYAIMIDSDEGRQCKARYIQ